MEFLNFPIVALGTALICLIGVTLYAITQRSSLRSRDEQLVVARAQAYAMLELSQAGVLFLDREHKLMGEASASAPELLGHTCGAGTPFVQVIAELVDVHVRRQVVDYLETLWQAAVAEQVDATQNPLARVHTGARHLALRFSRLVVDGRVHHIIVSIERISAPRVVPHTIEVPVLNEDTFARRLAGETGTRPALQVNAPAPPSDSPEPAPAQLPDTALTNDSASATQESASPSPPRRSDLGPLDATEDSLPSVKCLPDPEQTQKPPTLSASLPSDIPLADAVSETMRRFDEGQHLATTITSPDAVKEADKPAAAAFDPADIVDPADARRNEVLREIMHIDPARLEVFLTEASEKAGQLRAIIKLPAREPQAFREKLVLILELIRGIHARAERLPLASACERAARFEAALGGLRDKQTLSGNDFLPLAVKLDDLLSHLAIQGEVVKRLNDWRARNGEFDVAIDATRRSMTLTGTTIRQPHLQDTEGTSPSMVQPPSATQKTARLSDLSQESLVEMAGFLADMYSKRVSLVVVGLEDVPDHYRRPVEKMLGQLIHNAIRHGIEAPAERVAQQKPETGTIAVQFVRAGTDGYQLSVQDDGRGLDHEKIRAEAIRQGVLTAEAAATTDSRMLASLIFRAGFTTVGDDGARGIGMDVVRDLVSKAGGRVGIATKPGEYTRFRITLPQEKKSTNAAVA
jgi:signal transduction histidine kinase